jgi:hypothetical protein
VTPREEDEELFRRVDRWLVDEVSARMGCRIRPEAVMSGLAIECVDGPPRPLTLADARESIAAVTSALGRMKAQDLNHPQAYRLEGALTYLQIAEAALEAEAARGEA